MSNNRKNNHYHYAEKYAERRNHSRSGRSVYVPFKAVIASLVVLLMFGLISTTFGAYITESEPEYNPEKPGIISEVRNIKASRDVALTGANADLADTKGNVSGGTVVVEVPSGWTSYSHIQFGLYQNGYLWCSDDMTRIANTNFYYGSNPSHGSWNNESIMFMANNSHFGSGNFDGTNSQYYTTKITRAMSSNYYLFRPTGSSNAYTNAYVGNYTSLSAAIGVYNQTANIYTKTTSSGGYTSSGTGGNVTITASWLDTANNQAAQTTTPSSNGGTTITYENAVYHTAVTYNATANTGYRFVGWFSSTTATTADSTSTSYKYTSSLTGTKTLYARFIKTCSVSITKATASGTSGTFSGTPTITYNSSSSTSVTVDVGGSITLNSANSNSGIACTFHTGSATGTTITSPYTVTADTTIYAVYSMTAPTISSFSYAGSPTTVGASAISPSRSASSNASGTLSYRYTFVSSGSTSTSGYTLIAASGAFSATVPGKYVIRLTVTDTVSGLSRTATRDTTITVKPPAPDPSALKYTVEGYTDDYTPGTTGESYNLPIKVPINSTTYKITAYLDTVTSGYTYNWSNLTGNYNTTNGSITAISGAVARTATDTRIVDLCTDTNTALRVGADGHYAYQIRVTANINDVESDPTTLVLYYDVISDFLDIQYMSFTPNSNDYQKIYAEDNGIDNIVSTIRAGGTTFNTISWFSPNNINFVVQELWGVNFPITNSYGTFNNPVPNDAAHRTSALQTTFDVSNLMAVTGPKWFRIYMNDTGNQKTASATTIIHTTVGTSSSSADRPIYYVDNTDHTYLDTRVMAFYVLEGETAVHYQTAQTPISGRYRFYVPSDAKYIMFAHVATDSYVLPTFSGTTFSMTANSSYLKAWTETVDLTSSTNENKNVYTATSATLASGIYNYTGSMGVLN